MIIFTSNIEVTNNLNSPIIYNLSSFYNGYDNVQNLAVRLSLLNNSQMSMREFIYTVEFDILYANYILNNTASFCDLMKIMINASCGRNIVILVHHDEYRDAISESLIKLIQERYGYNCWEIDDVDDLESASESFFSAQGIMNLDFDKNKFDNLYIGGLVGPLNDLKDREY